MKKIHLLYYNSDTRDMNCEQCGMNVVEIKERGEIYVGNLKTFVDVPAGRRCDKEKEESEVM